MFNSTIILRVIQDNLTFEEARDEELCESLLSEPSLIKGRLTIAKDYNNDTDKPYLIFDSNDIYSENLDDETISKQSEELDEERKFHVIVTDLYEYQ